MTTFQRNQSIGRTMQDAKKPTLDPYFFLANLEFLFALYISGTGLSRQDKERGMIGPASLLHSRHWAFS